jgi:hypothetical protein
MLEDLEHYLPRSMRNIRAEERMQSAIEELEQENRLLRARNDRLEAELMQMQGRELKLQMALNTPVEPVQEPIGYFTVNDYDKWEQIDGISGKPLYERPAAQPAEWQKIECPICGDMAVATDIPAAQRQWVGLSPADRGECLSAGDAHGWIGVMEATEAKLKEKNA